MFFEPGANTHHVHRVQLRLSERRFLLRLGDLLAIIAAIVIALWIWSRVDQRLPFDVSFIMEQGYWFVILPVLWLMLASANDFYDLSLASSLSGTLGRLIIITLQLLVIYLIIFFLSPRDTLPRLFILYYGAASFILIGIWRIAQPLLLGWASEPRRALIVGGNWGAQVIIQAVREHAPGQYELVGIIQAAERVEQDFGGLEILGGGSEMLALAREYAVSEVIVATPCELPGELFQGVMDCYQHGISIVPMAILYERLTGRVPVEHVGKDWAIVLPIETRAFFNPYPVLKRLIDLALAVIGLALFTLILPVLALIMAIDSPGPIFFWQVRVGKAGQQFRVVKLRSMVPDAEKITGAVFASASDPRITRVGRLLRKSRLDEVPQLWNVLRGEMSIIGPRPERPEFIDELTRQIPFYRTRLAVKPGVTGWAQVRYAYVSDLRDHLVKLQYDLYYIRHQSLLLDFQIMIRTAWKMIRMAGT